MFTTHFAPAEEMPVFRRRCLPIFLALLMTVGLGACAPADEETAEMDSGQSTSPPDDDDDGSDNDGNNGEDDGADDPDENDGASSDDDDLEPGSESGVQPIVVAGDHPPGLPEGFRYTAFETDLTTASTGQIAFSAQFESSGSSTTDRGTGVWSGMPDALALRLRLGESAEGLPGNVLVSSLRERPIVTSNGSLMLSVDLDGAVTDANDQAIFVVHDDVLRLVFRSGDPAPGLDGILWSDAKAFGISDAGLLFLTRLRSGSTSEEAFVFWLFDPVSADYRVIAAYNGNPDAPADWLPENNLAPYDAACDLFIVSFGNYSQINDRGDVTLSTSLFSRDEDVECPGLAFLRWNSGEFHRIVDDVEPVPGIEAMTFNLAAGLLFSNLTPSGSVAFTTTLGDLGASANAVFVRQLDGQLLKFSLAGESLEPDYVRSILYPLEPIVGGSADGRYAQLAYNDLSEAVILSGFAEPMPYSTIDGGGTSPLVVAIAENDSVPGAAATAYFSELDLTNSTLLPSLASDAEGNLAFLAFWKDGSQTHQGIWSYALDGTLSPLLVVGQTLTINATEVSVEDIRWYGGSLGTGYGTSMDATGNVVTWAHFSQLGDAIVRLHH